MTSRDFILDWAEFSCGEKLLLVRGDGKLCEAWCCLVGAEAEAGAIGGYYNSRSFAHRPRISSPQGQGAVSGILIGKSRLMSTSLQIRLHLRANKERFCLSMCGSMLEDLPRMKTLSTKRYCWACSTRDFAIECNPILRFSCD